MNNTFILSILTAFGAGLLLNLTPCVLPAIPIKVRAILRSAGSDTRSRSIAAALFAFGSVLCFAAIGLTTALLGLQWGVLFQSRLFTVMLVVLLALLALANFLGKGLPVPDFVGAVRGAHFLEPFLSGLLGALLSTPCTGPLLGGILVFALTQPPAQVVAIFTAIGLGLALPYLILLARPDLLNRLPRAGAWTEIVRKSFSWILFGAALFFAQSLVPKHWIAPIWLAFSAMLLLWCVAEFWRNRNAAARIVIVLAAGALGTGALLGTGFVPTLASSIAWHSLYPHDVSRLTALGRPALVEFTADWCVNCRVLDNTAYQNPDVVSALRAHDVVPFRVDLTHSQPVLEHLLASYGGAGLPFAVVLDAKGQVRQRFSGLFTGQSLANALNQL